ncbi:MAG: VWA domain-containing protein, partial [Deltaproteobacteria bacterium]|nr:VWA domain-containing protein [Deltaproteobacteria bacterium]
MTALPLVFNVMSDEEVAALGRDPDAGFGALQTARGLLPLTAMDVDAKVAGVIASIEVAQTFVNTTGTAIEATYIFPLPDRAAVHRFRMEVAGRVIEGVVEERGAAREQYEEAIATGHRAAITEEERPGVFTLRVGNLMPGEAATVRLSLVGPLPVDDGEVTFRFPLVVAPRYIPGAALGGDQAGLGTAADTSLVPDASRISPPVMLPGCPNPVRLGIRVSLESGGLRELVSSLHATTSSRRDAQVIELAPGHRLDRDFILRWHVDGGELRSKLVCVDDVDGKAGTFALTLVPPSTTAMASKARDVVIVVDRSGSMAGWKMVAARRAAARMIDTLTSRDRFCAIPFDNVVELVPGAALVDATDRNRFKAVEALAKIDARGGTELAEPLRRAAQMLAGGTDDRERVIVLVTDGQVGNEDHILRELAPNLRNVRMFTLGIDQAVNAAFLKRLAAAGGGLCELVESEDRLDAVMAKVHRRIGTPIATDLSLRGLGLAIANATLAPKKLPDVYAGAPVTILGRYHGAAPTSARVELTGTTLGEAMCTTVEREGDTSAATWLAASWARAAIRDLEDQYATGARGELEHEIVALSKRHSVLSRFTAFLAVDRSAVVNAGGRLVQAVQPVETPAGWEGGAGAGAPGGGGLPMQQATLGSLGGVQAQGYAMPVGAAPPANGPPASPMSSRSDLPFARSAPRSIPSGPAPDRFSGGWPSDVRAPRPTEASPMPSMPGAPPMPSMPGAPPMPSMPGAPPPPPAHSPPASKSMAAPPSPGPARRSKGEEDRSASKDAAPVSSHAYLAALSALAKELDAQARAGAASPPLRLLKQRLVEWIEDVRS